MIPFEKVRRWQVQFEISNPPQTLLMPEVLVEEKQTGPKYRMDGKTRFDSGGQFVITLKGKGLFLLNGREFPLTPGKAFLHRHSDPAVTYAYPPDGTEPWIFLWMSMKGAILPQLFEDLNCRYGYLYDVPLDSELVRQLMSFKCENRQIRFLPPLEAAQFALNALKLLCETRENELADTPQSKLIKKVKSLIAADISGDLNTGRIAAQCALSREHLSRIFRAETGETLQQYVNAMRMKLAAELLRQTRLSIKEVAERCGYGQYSSFYRAFQKRFGGPPMRRLRDRGD